jgi:dTDP-4-dehydrorhamnose reductase
MRVLITGASGFIGAQLGRTLAKTHDVLGVAWTSRHSPDFPTCRLDLTEQDASRKLLHGFPADVVIHAAAMSRVVECEEHPAKAEEINVHATRELAREAAAHGARFLFFSSDMVFSGETGYYTEQSPPSPQNAYGRTKLRAEAAVLEANPRHLVVRLNLVVGRGEGFGTSFSERILEKIGKRGKASLFADQFRSPIHVRSVVSAVVLLMEKGVTGILHLGGPQRLSRAELGRALCRAAGIEEERIEEVSYLSHPQAALLPRDTSFGVGRREVEVPELGVRPIETELAADYEKERVVP